ncbi:restriction endonuclease subunit S [Verrucomicrobiales bacterium BCK34]|nr:restriction endonuclease subunit S [Verrucomicrobiales bacterium BCK34]
MTRFLLGILNIRISRMEMKQSFLKEIADVRIGLTLRGPDASKQIDEEGLHLLKIGDIKESGVIRIKTPHLIKVTKSMERFKVAPNDLVIANRGGRMTAALVDEKIQAIAGGQIYVVRADRKKVLPEYLWWFFNRPSTQRYLQYQASGSYVKTIPVQFIREEMRIPVPPMETQHQIAEIAQLARQEAEILKELSTLKATYREALFTQMLTGKMLPLSSPPSE